jgi:large subunit ribosomal protein L25
VAIALDAREALSHIFKGEKVFRLDIADGDAEDRGQMVLLKDLQFDHLGSSVVHADFVRVSLTDRVRTRVPIHLIGEAKGLKQAGSILMHPTNEVEVECVVTELPEYLEVDISELDLGHAITVRDIRLPGPGLRVLTDPNAMVAQIVIQQEVTVAEAAPAEAAAQPEVITAKKPEEEGAPAAAGEKKAGGTPAAKEAKAAPAKEAKKG